MACADAIGEITNMIAGSFRTHMAANGDAWAITVPTVTIGSDFYIKPLTNGHRVLIPFGMEGHEVFVELILTEPPVDPRRKQADGHGHDCCAADSPERAAFDWLKTEETAVPMLPSVALRVIELVSDPDVTVAALAPVVSKDQVLASRVIGLAQLGRLRRLQLGVDRDRSDGPPRHRSPCGTSSSPCRSPRACTTRASTASAAASSSTTRSARPTSRA